MNSEQREKYDVEWFLGRVSAGRVGEKMPEKRKAYLWWEVVFKRSLHDQFPVRVTLIRPDWLTWVSYYLILSYIITFK